MKRVMIGLGLILLIAIAPKSVGSVSQAIAEALVSALLHQVKEGGNA